MIIGGIVTINLIIFAILLYIEQLKLICYVQLILLRENTKFLSLPFELGRERIGTASSFNLTSFLGNGIPSNSY